MRWAIISDVHANLEALDAVLDEIDQIGVDDILCLGDLVGYYANPNECVEILRQRGVIAVAGNHDRAAIGVKEPMRFGRRARSAIEWTRSVLTDETRTYLEELPLVRLLGGRLLMVHAGLHPHPNEEVYLSSTAPVERSMQVLRRGDYGARMALYGHTHIGVLHEWRAGVLASRRADVIPLEPEGYYLLNPGSVGQPRDGDGRASFAVLDEERAEVRLVRVPYDRMLCYAKAVRAGLLAIDSASRSRTLFSRLAAVGQRVLRGG
jgi:predicted phosphodiesterase